MLTVRRLQTCQVQAFPAAGSAGPHQPGEGTAGISEMDDPKFQAPVSSSIIYKEYDVVP